MKSIVVFIVLMLLGVSLPTNAKTCLTIESDSLSIFSLLHFHVASGNDDDDDNNILLPFSQHELIITGKLYTNGKMELTFNSDEAVTVSINLNDAEVSSTEFVPTADDYSLTFDLNDYGRGAYEVNVAMPDGTVQTATFEY